MADKIVGETHKHIQSGQIHNGLNAYWNKYKMVNHCFHAT